MNPLTEHPFAPYIRALGKGKKGARSLTSEEARAAFGMILRGETQPEQTGAFLMLLRVKEESPDELAGFVEAVRDVVQAPVGISVDLDWSSYAGKRKHAPWFVLAALLLAENGVRVLIHGCDPHTVSRLYTEHCFEDLALPIAHDWAGVANALDSARLCFFPLRDWCAPLQALIDLRNIFGLRSPVHTLARLLNPLAAPASLQSIFHPAYAGNHQQAAQLLGTANTLVIKGDGGEFERRPDASCKLHLVLDGQMLQEEWPRRFESPCEPEADIDSHKLRLLWRDELDDAYGREAVIGTAALVLRLLQKAGDNTQAYALAQQWWLQRNRQRLS